MKCLDCEGTGMCMNCDGKGYHGEMHYDAEWGDIPDKWCELCEKGACYGCFGLGYVAVDSYQRYLAMLESPYANTI